MEVHHSHHPTHKKKWTEYLLEFLMLFCAVTLGFVAENVREHSIEKEREKQYMESFVADLESDLVNLKEGIPRKVARLQAIDTLFRYFIEHKGVTEVPAIIVRKMKRTAYDRSYVRNSTTINQLKNSGGLRLIRNKKVADSIAYYDWRWSRAEYWHDNYITMQKDNGTLNEKIIDANDIIGYYINNDSISNENSTPPTGIIHIHREHLNEYLNLLTKQYYMTKLDKDFYEKVITMTANLSELIKKEYKIE